MFIIFKSLKQMLSFIIQSFFISFFLRSLFNLNLLYFRLLLIASPKTFPFHGNGWTERERTVSLTWQSNQRAQPSAKSLQKSEEGKAIRIDKRTWRDLILRVWKRVSRWLSIKTTISLFFSSNYITYCNVVKENTPLVDLIDV